MGKTPKWGDAYNYPGSPFQSGFCISVYIIQQGLTIILEVFEGRPGKASAGSRVVHRTAA